MKTAWVRQGDQLTNVGSVLEWQGSGKTSFLREALAGAIFFCSLSTCLAWHWQVPFLLLFIILVKKNAPAQVFSQGVLSCSTHPSQRTSPKQLPAHPPSKCPLPASAAPPKQLLLQRVSPQPQHVHNSHSKASEPLTVGASPTVQQLTAITCRPLSQLA